jgi:hypothetical protein
MRPTDVGRAAPLAGLTKSDWTQARAARDQARFDSGLRRDATPASTDRRGPRARGDPDRPRNYGRGGPTDRARQPRRGRRLDRGRQELCARNDELEPVRPRVRPRRRSPGPGDLAAGGLRDRSRPQHARLSDNRRGRRDDRLSRKTEAGLPRQLRQSPRELVLRCIQMNQSLPNRSCPALCRASKETGKPCARSRGWPDQVGPSPARNE